MLRRYNPPSQFVSRVQLVPPQLYHLDTYHLCGGILAGVGLNVLRLPDVIAAAVGKLLVPTAQPLVSHQR